MLFVVVLFAVVATGDLLDPKDPRWKPRRWASERIQTMQAMADDPTHFTVRWYHRAWPEDVREDLKKVISVPDGCAYEWINDAHKVHEHGSIDPFDLAVFKYNRFVPLSPPPPPKDEPLGALCKCCDLSNGIPDGCVSETVSCIPEETGPTMRMVENKKIVHVERSEDMDPGFLNKKSVNGREKAEWSDDMDPGFWNKNPV